MFQIVFHPLVVKRDFKDIPRTDGKKIKHAIQKKLMENPEHFGKPLHKELKGHYRLRVDFYRIIYRIEKERVTVFVIHIGLRKDAAAYREAQKRLA